MLGMSAGVVLQQLVTVDHRIKHLGEGGLLRQGATGRSRGRLIPLDAQKSDRGETQKNWTEELSYRWLGQLGDGKLSFSSSLFSSLTSSKCNFINTAINQSARVAQSKYLCIKSN